MCHPDIPTPVQPVRVCCVYLKYFNSTKTNQYNFCKSSFCKKKFIIIQNKTSGPVPREVLEYKRLFPKVILCTEGNANVHITSITLHRRINTNNKYITRF